MIQISYRDPRPIYEQIKARVAEGRWEPEGGMWVEADCNITSGESFIPFSVPTVSLSRRAISVPCRGKGALWRMREIRPRCGGKNCSHSSARSAQS